MASQDPFRDLYHEKIQPVLQKQESFRKRVIAFMVIGPVLLLILFTNAASFNFLTTVAFIAAGLLSSVYGFYHYQDYKIDYKKRVNAEIIKLINPNHKYFYEKHFDLTTVLASGLYHLKPDTVTGDDFVAGKIKGVPFEFCELNMYNAYFKETLFRGLFFKIGLNRSLPGNVYVLSDQGSQLLTNEDRNFQKELGPRIGLPHRFSLKFTAFSFKEEAAMQLLGPHMQEALLALQKEIDRDINIAFHKDHIYCTVVVDESLFEPKLLQKGPQPGQIVQSFEFFTIINRIIHYLSLDETQIEEDTASHLKSPAEVVPEIAKLARTPIASVPNESLEIDQKIDVTIDQSLDLQALNKVVLELEQDQPTRDLQTYLRALYQEIVECKEQIPTQALIQQLLTDSFNSKPCPMAQEWLDITISPDIEKLYLKAQTPEDMDFFSKSEHYGWDEKSFTLEVLKFQIAELEKMKGHQLDNAMRQYGVSSQTGTPWYNFDPISNLKSGIKQLLEKNDSPTQVNWALIGTLLQLGRVND